jgi:hypothetical protein
MYFVRRSKEGGESDEEAVVERLRQFVAMYGMLKS